MNGPYRNIVSIYTCMGNLLDRFHLENTRTGNTVLTPASTGEIMLEIAVIVSNFLNRCKINTAMPKTAEYSYNDAGQCSIISLE